MIDRIQFIEFFVYDLSRAVEFYKDTLGFEVIGEVPLPGTPVDESNRVLVRPPRGETGIMLVATPRDAGDTHDMDEPDSEFIRGYAGIVFATEDVPKTYEVLQRSGTEIVSPPTGKFWSIDETRFCDPDGHVLSIMDLATNIGIENRPSLNVTWCLQHAIDVARLELSALPPRASDSVTHWGGVLAQAKKMFANPADEEFVEHSSVFEYLQNLPWFRHAVEIEVASEGVDRTSGALDRFEQLIPVVTERAFNEKALEYIREISHLFMFGFDGPCIAFCGAALEQILNDVVVVRGEYTEARLRRERPSADTLLREATRLNVVTASLEDAHALFEQRNTVMHRHLWDTKIIRGMALECIEKFSRVIQDIGGHLAE